MRWIKKEFDEDGFCPETLNADLRWVFVHRLQLRV